MKRVVAGALFLAASSCALVSGLSSLDVEDGADASFSDVIELDVAPKPDVSVDAPAEASTDAELLDARLDAGIDAPKDVIDAAPPSIQCGASTCPLTSICCHKTFPHTFTCLADASTCPGQGNYAVTCDVRSCANGQVCCVAVTNGYGLGAACATTCGLPNTRLCAQDGAACGNGLACGPSQLTFPPYDICK